MPVILPTLVEIGLLGVAEPGIPNRERVVLRPMQSTNLISYGVLAGMKLEGGSVMPLWDRFFWFGDFVVTVPSWILLYTGPGQFRQTHDINTGQPIYEWHWNRAETIFAGSNIVPIVFQMGGVLIGHNDHAPAQLPPQRIQPPQLPDYDPQK